MAAVESTVSYEALQMPKKLKMEGNCIGNGMNHDTNGSLLVKKLSLHATVPTRGSSLAAGYDLYR